MIENLITLGLDRGIKTEKRSPMKIWNLIQPHAECWFSIDVFYGKDYCRVGRDIVQVEESINANIINTEQ